MDTKTHLCFEKLPFLSHSRSEQAPHVPAHFHIRLSQDVQLDAVPLLGVLLLHQSLVPLSAGIWRLGGEVFRGDLIPVEALGPGLDESLIVFR
jgi:hypothetical protein